MRILHRLSALAVLGAAVLMSGCSMLNPCQDTGNSINGTWAIVSVNGQPIPTTGYPLPSGSDRLAAGTLSFQMLREECEGDVLTVEEGPVVADYTLLTAAGAPKPSQTYAGSFSHSLIGTRVSVSADGRTVPGTAVTSTGLMTYAGTLPNLSGLTVVLRRVK
jgi:hypothetical protein